MRRLLVLSVTAALILCASAGSAWAGRRVVCMGGPGSEVTVPEPNGTCAEGSRVPLVGEGEFFDLQEHVSELRREVGSLKDEVRALHTLLAGVTRVNDGRTLRFSDMDLQLVNGRGSTTTTNGLGNLIIGYNEDRGAQTGSHNLVLGKAQTFTSYGGLVGGHFNRSTGPFSVVFGSTNTASAQVSTVLGGSENTASGSQSAILGGIRNTAAGPLSAVVGGSRNVAGSLVSSVLGGGQNTTFGTCQAIPAAPGAC